MYRYNTDIYSQYGRGLESIGQGSCVKTLDCRCVQTQCNQQPCDHPQCNQQPCGCQPVTCRPCCCPTYVICCCGSSNRPAPVQTYSVTYDPNGGTGGTTDTGIAPVTQYTIKTQGEAGVTRAGYTFTGWNTQANGTGTSYPPNSTAAITGDLKLYAQWTPAETYTVSYNANGGTGEYSDTGIAPATQYSVKSNVQAGITREGYTFSGWNTESAGGGTEYQAGAVMNVNGNVILYAQWDPVTFDVNYEANGGTGQYNDPDITGGTQYTIKTQPETGITRTGYTFTGWNTQANGTGTAYTAGSQTTITGNLTLYAQWTPTAAYTVTYDANGGTGEYADRDIAAGSQYTVKNLAQTGITNSGKTLTSWNTQTGGTGTSYAPDSSITVNSDLTLYAQWSS